MERLDHVVLDPLDELGMVLGASTAPAARRRRASGRAGIPRWRRGPSGPRPACRCGSLSRLQRSTQAAPLLGHLGEDVDPGADVLAALGVVRRERRQRVRPSGLPVPVVRVHRLGLDAEPAGLAADLVERDQAVVDVEGRVLDPLGHHRRRHLLELAGEPPLLGPVLLAERLGRLQQQHVADEAEDPAAHQRVAGRRPAGRRPRRSAGPRRGRPSSAMYER